MKLATAIQRGSKLVNKQLREKFVAYHKDVGVCGCAMGAAYLACYPEELELVEKRQTARGVNERAAVWAKINGQGDQSGMIFTANDQAELSFSEIVEYVKEEKKLEGWLVRPFSNVEIEVPPIQELKDRVAMDKL
jgi:hypothetical protein